MKAFMDEDFLLTYETAKTLYHQHAKHMPIYDYHCHLSPKEIAENKSFSSLTEIWLGGDHYKWRAMRAMGHPEELITGEGEQKSKFLAWAQTAERLIGNPLYHWTALELKRYFGIEGGLSTSKAQEIWERANSQLGQERLSVRGILKEFNVYAVGTTDDPIDNLEYHRAIRNGTAPIGPIATQVLPSFRPDSALNIEKADFPQYIQKLAEVADMPIVDYEGLVQALARRVQFFKEMGCLSSDHGLEYAPISKLDKKKADVVFKMRMKKKQIDKKAEDLFRFNLLVDLAQVYAQEHIAMQIHLSAIRNNNTPLLQALGPDTGFDASHDQSLSQGLSLLLDAMATSGNMPKIILYSLNPKDYYPLATLVACHQNRLSVEGPAIKSRSQLGAAWWFLDHRDGIEEQLKIAANTGVLANFIGMLTDSRSFLSYPRHEYFRRILCNLIGSWVEQGEILPNMELLGEIIEDVCFNNAKNYFEAGIK